MVGYAKCKKAKRKNIGLFYSFMSYINTGKATLTAGTEILYTGTLDISANNNELLSLAEMYQVETLTKICQFAFRESDIEDLTTLLFALI